MASEILQSLIMKSKKKRNDDDDDYHKKEKKNDGHMQTFEITIPDSVEGKETIEFQLPDGRTVSVEVPAELKAGDRLHVKVPYPEKHNGIVASPPPNNLYRIVADNTNFFSGSKTGHLMYPAFDVADKLLGFVLGKAYYRKENYTDLELPVAVNRIKEMLTKTPTGLVYTLNDARGASSTPTELIALVASQHCKRQTAKQVELATTKSCKKQRSVLSPVTGLKKRPYCPKPAQPPHIATGRWSTAEHALFLKGLAAYGKEWKKVSKMIPSRTVVQIRTHAQKYFQKLEKQKQKEFAHRERWNAMRTQTIQPRTRGPNSFTPPPPLPRRCGSSMSLLNGYPSRGMHMMDMMPQDTGMERDHEMMARLMASMRWQIPQAAV